MNTLDFLIQNKMTTEKLNIKVEYLIDGFLVKQSLNNIFAKAGMGKSYLMLGICIYLLDNFKIDKCFYLDMDNSYMALKSRNLDKIISEYNNFIYFHGSSYKGNPREILKNLGTDSKNDPAQFENNLIIIDSIRNFTQDMLNETEVKSILTDLQTIRDAGATIIFLHHTTKESDGKQFKGTTSFVDSVDIAYALSSKKENNKLNYTLNVYKDRIPVKDVSFILDTVTMELNSEDIEIANVSILEKEFIKIAKLALKAFGDLTQTELIILTGRSPNEKTKRKYLKKYVNILWTIEVKPQENNSTVYSIIEEKTNNSIKDIPKSPKLPTPF